MYGWLLESVQYFVVEECGEEIWEIILQEVGAKNTIFNARQQYPDTLMLRLASALARFTKDPKSPAASRSVSPSTRKSSFKSKPTWRSSSVNTDGRVKTIKCPFTSTNALTAATKKEIEAYNSSEEIDRRKEEEFWQSHSKYQRKSAALKLDDFKPIQEYKVVNNIDRTDDEDDSDDDHPAISKCPLSLKPELSDSENKAASDAPVRKTSCAVAVDVYRRRESSQKKSQVIPRAMISEEKRNYMRKKFETPEQAMLYFGRCFVKFFTKYKYDSMIRATGRYFCTFLQSVDSIHQRMRFTYPRMLSPTMQLTRAHIHGAELVYSSTRTGFAHYLIGQLYEIAEDIFSLKLKASIVKESTEGNYNVVVLKLEFDNSDYKMRTSVSRFYDLNKHWHKHFIEKAEKTPNEMKEKVQSVMLKKNPPESLPPVPASLLLQLFPFGVMLDRKMKIMMAGEKLVGAWGGPSRQIIKCAVSEILRLRKPKVPFTWDKVVCMQNMMFELELLRCSIRRTSDSRRGSQGARAILLKGPIYFLTEIDALIFLCSPIFNSLEELQQAGLYLADMNGHGLSKELVHQGWQHLSRLELLFEKAETRSNSLEKTRRLRDDWKKKGDQLLYSMIPKPFTVQLRAGKDAKAFWQAFDSVTIMFVGVQLSEAGSRADVMQTVAYMNDVYSRIDRLLDTHRVYKVETVGTVYLLVSGAPERQRKHADCVASAALAVSRTIPKLTIGINSGPCVAGVLSLRVPRYCVVGDTVNTASRMQTTCEPGRIQISAASAEQLSAGRFRLRKRGTIKVKGKGMMETYWLEGEIEEEDPEEALQLFSTLCGEE